ncbi:MAG: hypothetical protein QME64_08240, partial [bacterium]|nr:hypothetical protein [bacterium]
RSLFILGLIFLIVGFAFAEEQVSLPAPSVSTSTTNSISTTVAISTTTVADDSAKKGVITLRWRTESEQDNYGFNVYRSESKDGQFEKINPTIIRGHGTTSEPHDYVYVDKEVYKGKTYYYYLMDVDFSGNTKKFTPTINRYLPTDEEAQAEKEKKEEAQPKVSQKPTKDKAKVIVFIYTLFCGLVVALLS